MWARVIEFTISCWLAMSPFILRYPDEPIFFWASDLITSSLIAFFAIVSFYRSLRKMHLCNLAVSGYLIFLGYWFKESTPQPTLQNYVVVALLLLMIAVVPSEADQPPVPWREFYKK